MADTPSAPAPGLPGVPAGSPAPGSVAAPGQAMAPFGPAGAPVLVPKPLFGGNVGKKLRYDGLKAGSPEAIAANRVRDAARKKLERAAKSAATPPPPLPASDAPLPETLPGLAGPETPSAGAEAGIPFDAWTAEDFRFAAPELVELAEAWRIDVHTRHAVAGKLPQKLVAEIAKDAAFPPGSKRSLSNSSPVTLAKMFNALHVPAAFKPVITTAPALVYIIVRDLQTGARIDKLIALQEEGARVTTASLSVKPDAPGRA